MSTSLDDVFIPHLHPDNLTFTSSSCPRELPGVDILLILDVSLPALAIDWEHFAPHVIMLDCRLCTGPPLWHQAVIPLSHQHLGGASNTKGFFTVLTQHPTLHHHFWTTVFLTYPPSTLGGVLNCTLKSGKFLQPYLQVLLGQMMCFCGVPTLKLLLACVCNQKAVSEFNHFQFRNGLLLQMCQRLSLLTLALALSS